MIHYSPKPSPSPSPRGRRVIVGIPTVARPEIVLQTVQAMAAQTRLPDLVLLSVTDPADTGGAEAADLPFPVEVLRSAPGLTRQRNRILTELHSEDLLLFLDDDFLMAPDYLAVMEQVFDANPEVVLATGTLVADGIIGPGLSHPQGQALLEKDAKATPAATLHPAHTGYGCNTALRGRTVLEADLFYDERLPLYGWFEDVDFSNRIMPLGRFVRPENMRGVHLGTKTGRTPGLKLGYSQVANLVYLVRKGTLTRRRAYDMIARNVLSNLYRTIRPVPWADHSGRLRGNLVAVADVVLGRADPQRVLGLKSGRGQAARAPGVTAPR